VLSCFAALLDLLAMMLKIVGEGFVFYNDVIADPVSEKFR